MERASSLRARDRGAAIVSILALLIGLGSYLWANRHPEFIWDGPLLLSLACFLVVVAYRRVALPEGRAAGDAEGWTWPSLAQVSRWRLLAFGASVTLSLVLLVRLLAPDRPHYDLELLLWLGSIVTFIVSIAPPVSRPREDWALWWEVHRNPALVLGFLFLLAAGLRLWNLQGIPATLGGDEASQGLEALRVISGEIRNPFSTGWMGMPTMSFFYNSIGFRLLDDSFIALRLPWSLIGTVTVLPVFWLVTRLHGLTLGLMTAALFATYHYHIHYSRLGANNIADPLFVSLALLYLYRARDRNSPLDWAMAGVVAGVAQYFYPGARFTILLIGVCVLHFFWSDRGRREEVRDLIGGALALAGAFLVTAAPILQYALRFPDQFNSRLNQIGILQSGWLAEETVARGVPTLVVLWDQFIRAFLSFNVYPDRTVWYGSPRPLMDGLWAVLFMLGLLYATMRFLLPTVDRRLLPFVAWWWMAMLLGGMLTESPPSTARLIVLAPPACFFVALALMRSVQAVYDTLGQRAMREIAPLLVAVVVVLSALSIRWYFWEYTPMNLYGSRNAEIATAVGHYLAAEQEPDQTVLFLGPPFVYFDFATIPYLAPDATGIDIHEPLTLPPTPDMLGLPPGQRPLFIAIPLRAEEMRLVEQAFPGGQHRVVDDSRGEMLFQVYEP
jgi:phage shock protein PspC (stress-responsive transcriptional regulator)